MNPPGLLPALHFLPTNTILSPAQQPKPVNLLWTILFTASIAQALFLLSLVVFRKSKNRLAATLIAVMLGIMVLPNINHLALTTGLYRQFPGLFGISFGMVLLFGPLCFFYTRAILDSAFAWRWGVLVHGLPYLAYRIHFSLTSVQPTEVKIAFAEAFLDGTLQVRPAAYWLFAASDLHFAAYLYLSFRTVAGERDDSSYLVPLAARRRWLKRLLLCFGAFLAVIAAYFAALLVTGTFSPTVNYLYTLALSGIIYVIAYQLVLNPDLVSPDFSRKYGASQPIQADESRAYLERLRAAMEEGKAFLDPELKLPILAATVGLPAYQLSRLINTTFGKSFSDYVNEYRVREFVRRVNAPEYAAHSIYGIALGAGFNSKSSFNAAFKKITGQTPSAVRRGKNEPSATGPNL